MKMWVEDRKEHGMKYQEVMHEFFEKEMVSPRVIHQQSALAEKVKRTTLTQEIIRIRKNTSKRIREDRKGGQMSRMMWKLWRSGYSEKSRREVIIAGLRGFKRLEDLESKGERSLNRSRRENWAARKLKKFNSRTDW